MKKHFKTPLFWHPSKITRKTRATQKGHRSCVIWLTGLSGSGKSTLAHALDEILYQKGCHSFVLDGDNVRHGLCSDLNFSETDRKENIRRVAETAKLFVEAGIITITAFISPFAAERQKARELFSENDFIEIYCDTPIEICEKRDIKGLYQKARKGEIPFFTGISSPYEPPLNPELILKTDESPLENCVMKIVKLLQKHNVIK